MGWPRQQGNNENPQEIRVYKRCPEPPSARNKFPSPYVFLPHGFGHTLRIPYLAIGWCCSRRHMNCPIISSARMVGIRRDFALPLKHRVLPRRIGWHLGCLMFTCVLLDELHSRPVAKYHCNSIGIDLKKTNIWRAFGVPELEMPMRSIVKTTHICRRHF